MGTIIAAGVLLLLYVVLPVLLLMVRDRLEKRASRRAYEQALRDHPEQCPGTPEYELRYDRPRFEELETLIGRPLPQSYRRLFSDHGFVRKTWIRFTPPGAADAMDRADVHQFIPADAAGLEERWPCLDASQLVFATIEGDNYYLALDEGGGEDAPVYLFYHDGGDHRRIADSLQQFLSWRTTPISFDN